MPNMGRKPGRRQIVVRLVQEGQGLYARGNRAAAIEQFQRACALVRESVAAEPQNPDHPQQLGSVLYMLGEWLLEADRFEAAVDALNEAEAEYGKLGRQAAHWISDVLVRRARVHTVAREPLSAIADAQQAVLPLLDRPEYDVGGPHFLDAARVMALVAQVQLQTGGDPDLAVSAADWALRAYMTGARVGNQLALPPGHESAVRIAAQVAYIVHSAARRAELATAASSLLMMAGGNPAAFAGTVAQVRDSQPTLAEVFASVDRTDLVDALTAPAVEVTYLVPVMRCHPQLAPVRARELADLQAHVPGRASVLLGLEAHALFSAASQLQVPTMRYTFGDHGVPWAAAVLNFGQLMLEADEVRAALDAANWLTGIVGRLLPLLTVAPDGHSTALACVRWQHALYQGLGNTAAAARVGQVLATLESTPRP